jgi:hypothetical protein
MSQVNGLASALTASNGRSIKFTPERLEQIRNLVERGMPREQIAETIGCTLGSLQVTCSRMGISLRRPKPDVATPAPAPVHRERQPATTNHQKCRHVTVSHGCRTIDLKLSADLLGRLAIEAHFENLTLSDLISKLLTSALKGPSSHGQHASSE